MLKCEKKKKDRRWGWVADGTRSSVDLVNLLINRGWVWPQLSYLFNVTGSPQLGQLKV